MHGSACADFWRLRRRLNGQGAPRSMFIQYRLCNPEPALDTSTIAEQPLCRLLQSLASVRRASKQRKDAESAPVADGMQLPPRAWQARPSLTQTALTAAGSALLPRALGTRASRGRVVQHAPPGQPPGIAAGAAGAVSQVFGSQQAKHRRRGAARRNTLTARMAAPMEPRRRQWRQRRGHATPQRAAGGGDSGALLAGG